ncbi:RanBP2-type zinc finger protein [Zea mays]|uniref:RanBP2-type zinc finger protein n=1 Tax=Zea mays TaxID=4577 RepID=A0A1D6KJ66_MAIZE|nr:RanBP2-type zinc finger protein [Zea mays]
MVLPHFILAVDCLLVAFMERVCGYFCLPACIYVVLLLLAIQKAMQTPPHYPTSGGYMGPGTPPSMYLGGGAPPYGSSMFNGPAVTRYGIPQFPGGSAYSYGYGGPIPMGSPYGPMQIAGPTPYSGGTMMTAGGMYGIPMDRYGPIPAGPGPMVCALVIILLYTYYLMLI